MRTWIPLQIIIFHKRINKSIYISHREADIHYITEHIGNEYVPVRIAHSVQESKKELIPGSFNVFPE